MTNLEISKRLSEARFRMYSEEHFGLRAECQRLANLLIEARPGRLVRRQAIALLSRCDREVPPLPANENSTNKSAH